MGRVTWALIAINVIVFELIFSMPEPMMNAAFGALSFSSPLFFELWRLVTSLFLHASASHLFFNMLGLYFFGKITEEQMDRKRFVLLYFIAGIVGSLIYGFTSADPAVGASGCVFGLMGYAMLMNPKKTIRMYTIPLPLGMIAIIYAIVESMLVYFGDVMSGVAHITHVTGMIVGALFAFHSSAKKASKGILWLILFLFILIALGPILGIILWIGNLVLGAVDVIVGFVLYGIAKLIGIILW
ncbi:MAG: rhomboid family intramembrane serine protease [Candidatus Aenigmarchaeota archaeon]|nr:rhomboid family intramembrane serine protease [Candidatus Aenigmarchaeota archaeon]